MSSKLVVQVEPERLELRLRGASALAAGTVYAPIVLEGARGAVAPALRLFRDETCVDAVAWTSEPASPVPHHSRLMSFPSLRLDTEATLGWFSDVRDAKSLPSSARVWGWLVAVDMGNGSDVGPVVLGASRVPVLLHDFSPVETDPGESWSAVLAELVADAIAGSPVDPTLGTRVSALETNKQDVIEDLAAIRSGAEAGATALQDTPTATETLAAEEYSSPDNSVTVDTPSRRDVKLKIRNRLSNTVNTLDTSKSGTIATREWVQEEVDVPLPSDDDPAPNGAAWEGESDRFSRADHVHPTDLSRAAAEDLRYSLVTPEVERAFGFPDSMFPVVFTADGTSYTVNSADDLFVDSLPDGLYLNAYIGEGDGLKEAVVLCAVDRATGQTGAPYVESLTFNGENSTTLAAELSVVLDGRAGNSVVAAPSTTTATLTLPAAVPGHMRDLVVDVDNFANSSDLGIEFASDAIAYIDAGGARYLLGVVEGDDLADLTTVAAGARARLYLTETAQKAVPTGGTEAVPVISLQRLTITVGGAA